MIKKLFIIVLVLGVMGCSAGEKISSLMEDPQYLFKDREFYDYKEQLSEVEKSYLNKEISYADYLDQRAELDAAYDKAVKQRSEGLN